MYFGCERNEARFRCARAHTRAFTNCLYMIHATLFAIIKNDDVFFSQRIYTYEQIPQYPWNLNSSLGWVCDVDDAFIVVIVDLLTLYATAFFFIYSKFSYRNCMQYLLFSFFPPLSLLFAMASSVLARYRYKTTNFHSFLSGWTQ